jgi:hypothetical protein
LKDIRKINNQRERQRKEEIVSWLEGETAEKQETHQNGRSVGADLKRGPHTCVKKMAHLLLSILKCINCGVGWLVVLKNLDL